LNLLIPEVTIEECAEVIQAIVKIQRFGFDCRGYDNKAHLAVEVGQLQWMLNRLIWHWELDPDLIINAYKDKQAAIYKYAQISHEVLAGA